MAISFLGNQSVDNSIEFVGGSENYATLKMVSQGLEVSVGDPANTTNPLVHFDGAYERVLIGSTTAANTPYLRIGGAGNQSSRLELAETTTGVGRDMNYGFSFNQTGNVSNKLEIKRHSNSTTGSNVITLARDNSNVEFGGDLTVSGGDITLGGTGRIQGIDTVSASTDAANKAYVDAHGGGVGPFLPLSAGSGSPLTGTLHGTSTNFSGSGDYAGSMTLGTGASTAEAHLTIGQGRTGNGYSYIDLVGDATYTDYGLRVIRGNSGANTTSQIIHKGTGLFSIVNPQGADIALLPSTGNVGIGTTNPGYKLHVDGGGMQTTTATLNRIAYYDGNGIGAYSSTGYSIQNYTNHLTIGNNADDKDIIFKASAGSAASVEIMRVDGSSGNVGIGTTGPGAKLDIISSGLSTMFRLSNTEADATTKYGSVLGRHYTNAEENVTGMLITSSSSNTGGRISIGGGISAANAVNDILFYTAANNTTLTGSERMRIDASGNVGIGTTSPSSRLQVYDDRDVTANPNDKGIRLQESTGDWLFSLGIKNVTNTGFAIRDNVTSAYPFVIRETTGKVGIGTTNPSTKLHVVGSAGEFALTLQNTGNGDGLKILTANQTANNGFLWNQGSSNLVNMYSSSTTNASKMIMLAGGVDKIFFNTEGDSYLNGGNVGIGTTSPQQKLHVQGGAARIENAATGLGGFVSVGNNTESAGNYSAYFFGNTAQDQAYFKAGIAYETLASTYGRGDMHFLQNSSTSGGNVTIADSVMTILNGGNVGIGTTSPNAKLQIVGKATSSSTVSADSSTTLTTKGYVDAAVSARITPAAPTTISTTIVGETIEISFNQSATSNIDYYQVWSSDDGADYGIIAQIAPSGFSSTMTVVDSSFFTGGTMAYRVYAVREGIYSSPGTASRAYTVAALAVTNMSVVNLNTAYYIQYEKPITRFLDHVEIYMDSETTQAALNRSGAVLIYSGQNASYMKSVGNSNNFHQFWVEIVTS